MCLSFNFVYHNLLTQRRTCLHKNVINHMGFFQEIGDAVPQCSFRFTIIASNIHHLSTPCNRFGSYVMLGRYKP